MGKERLKRYRPPWQRALIIILSILFALVFILSFFLIADAFAHSHARVVPDYAMDEDGLIAVLEKPKDGWSDEDYAFVYRQTGLTKVYFDGSDAVNRTFVLNCQRDLFYDEDISHESPVIGASHDCFDDKYMTMVPLERGDVVLSSSVHTLGWSNGHASIVVRGGSAAAVVRVGRLGDVQVGHARVAGTEAVVTVKLPENGQALAAGQAVVLRPEPGSCYLFDENGRAA